MTSPSQAPLGLVRLNPETAEAQAAIREQLERLLETPLFRNSKRYPTLLRYLVELTLAGRASELKERTLGIEVFGRREDYDCSLDPVVRTSAGEVRKRIAQYYHEPQHQAEIRIDLQPGSYVPEFHSPAPVLPIPPAFPVIDLASPAVPELPVARPSRARIWVALIVVLLLASLGVIYTRTALTAVDLFWNPVLDSPQPIVLCVGRDPSPPGSTSLPVVNANKNIPWGDVLTLSRFIQFCESRKRAYQVQRSDQTSLSRLQRGASVVIGAFNDGWTLRLLKDERFGFEQDGDHLWITDRQSSPRRRWGISREHTDSSGAPLTSKDYAVISRAVNPMTGRVAVVLAGLGGSGTMAAGKFITEPGELGALLDRAPKDWNKKNLQVVIETEVVDDNPAPSRVLAAHFW